MKKTSFYCFVMFLLVSGGNVARAQSSFLDSTFGIGGIVITPPPMAVINNSGSFSSIAIQPDDNKIVAAGGAIEHILIGRYNENGTFDSTFAINGIFDGGPVYSGISAMVLQNDGKIIGIGGNLVIRLNSGGIFDNSFGSGGVANPFSVLNGYAIALQADGKIVIAGSANSTSIGVGRLLPSGVPDSTFGTNGIVITGTWSTWAWGSGRGVAIMPDGRIVAGGESYKGFIAIRMLPDGTPDTSFNHSGVITTVAGYSYDYCHSLRLQQDGKVILSGGTVFGSNGEDFTLIRYNIDGTIDRSFGDTGVVNIDFNGNDDEATSLWLASDGKITVTGSATVAGNMFFGLCRLNANGVIDSSFGNSGRITTFIQSGRDVPGGIALQGDRKIVLAGHSYNSSRLGYDPTLVRYTDAPTGLIGTRSEVDYPTLFPNPASERLNINGYLSNITTISAYDIYGNKILSVTNFANSSFFIRGLTDGPYFFKISFSDRPPVVQKVLIQNK